MSSLKDQFSNIVESVFLGFDPCLVRVRRRRYGQQPHPDARAARHGRNLRTRTTSAPERSPACCAYWFSAASASSASFAAVAQAGGEGEFDAVVERYVAEGLRSNLALQSETSRSREVQRRRSPQHARDSFPRFRCRPATRAPKADASSRCRSARRSIRSTPR